ncbi:hypothetical protein [Priestia sp. 40]|uniref:hypothetical protein n=1 Tax=Priestia sp. 40 TaxID=3394459 RepID=UPI003BF777F7
MSAVDIVTHTRQHSSIWISRYDLASNRCFFRCNNIVISFGPTGGSFIGRIVIVIVEMAVPPWPSDTNTVN